MAAAHHDHVALTEVPAGQGDPAQEELFADLSERLRTAHRRVAALPLDGDGKGRVVRRLLAVTNLAKHDLQRASARLDALLADLDAGRAPTGDGDDPTP